MKGLDECTFKPTINYPSSRERANKETFNRLYKDMYSLQQAKEKIEHSQFPFQPKRVTKKNDSLYSSGQQNRYEKLYNDFEIQAEKKQKKRQEMLQTERKLQRSSSKNRTQTSMHINKSLSKPSKAFEKQSFQTMNLENSVVKS